MTDRHETDNHYIFGPCKGVDHVSLGDVERFVRKIFNDASIENRADRCVTFDLGEFPNIEELREALSEAFGTDVICVHSNTMKII